MIEDELIRVYYYDCNCDWWTKYCDEHHRRSAFVSRSILESNVKGADRG